MKSIPSCNVQGLSVRVCVQNDHYNRVHNIRDTKHFSDTINIHVYPNTVKVFETPVIATFKNYRK